LRDIAKILGRSDTTLGRELKRNAKYGAEYIPCKADRLAVNRAKKQRYKAPLKNPQVFLYVRKHLREPFGWSPEVIAAKLAIDHPGESIHHETIYRYIYSQQFKTRGLKLWQHLTLTRPKRMKKLGRTVHRPGKIPGSISIDFRPEEVNLRQTVGHWETDNVIGKTTDKTALSVTVERLTRLTILTKLKNRSAQTKKDTLVSRLLGYPKKARLTLTADNGAENSYHLQITEKLGLDVFFAHAYHSWEKGTVENTNGRIRRYIPKGVSLDQISSEQIQALEHKLNSTPRKCLRYLTPYEKMVQVVSTLS